MGGETSNCRERLKIFCVGYGVDIGYGGDPIIPNAITIDLPVPYTKVGDAPLNLGGDARDLYWFTDESLDYVYSSHLLEDFPPDEKRYREHCKKTGQSYNLAHKVDHFDIDYLKRVLEPIPNIQIINENPLSEQYSFEIAIKKIGPTSTKKELLKYENADFIRNVYRRILKREPDDKGFDLYLSQLKDGKLSKEEIIMIFKTSKEYIHMQMVNKISEMEKASHTLHEMIEGPPDVFSESTDDGKLLDIITNHVINRDFGNIRVLGITESGFYGQEFLNNTPIRWTSGTAKINFQLDHNRIPRTMSLDILSTGGVKEKRVRMLANGHELFDRKIPDGGYSQLFSLSDVPMQDILSIQIISDTHIPSEVFEGSLDNRSLGVLLKGIILSDKIYDFININLGSERIWGVGESGFYGQEFWGKGPFRWTNGTATLTIPVDKKRLPNAMHVEIDSPGKRVKIVANGHELMNGQIPEGGYFQLLSLSLVPFGKELTIELLSDTHIPKKTINGSTDDRPLGILVKSIRLLAKDQP